MSEYTQKQIITRRQARTQQSEKNSHRNSGYFSFQSDNDLEDNKETVENILLNLRNKLAEELSANETLTVEINNYKKTIDDLTREIKHKNDTIENLKDLLKATNKPIIQTNVCTQTEMRKFKDTGTQPVAEQGQIKIHIQQSQPVQCTAPNNNEHSNQKLYRKNIKRRILLLADEQARNFSKIFYDFLPHVTFSVQVIFKPNATFEDVIKDYKNLAAGFTKDDYVIIMAGSIDALTQGYIRTSALDQILKDLSNTNLIVSTIPRWPSRVILNEIIKNINENLLKKINHIKHGQVFNINEYLNRYDVKNKTNELTRRAKYKICALLANQILLDTIKVSCPSTPDTKGKGMCINSINSEPQKEMRIPQNESSIEEEISPKSPPNTTLLLAQSLEQSQYQSTSQLTVINCPSSTPHHHQLSDHQPSILQITVPSVSPNIFTTTQKPTLAPINSTCSSQMPVPRISTSQQNNQLTSGAMKKVTSKKNQTKNFINNLKPIASLQTSTPSPPNTNYTNPILNTKTAREMGTKLTKGQNFQKGASRKPPMSK